MATRGAATKKRGGSSPSKIVRTLTEVAEHFGVSKAVISQSWSKTGMPGKPGAYDLDKIGQWKRSRAKDPDAKAEEEQQAPKLTTLKESKLEAESRAKLADAIRKERENKLADENLVARDEVNRFFAGYNEYLRDRLLDIPAAIRSEFPDEFFEKVLEAVRARVSDTLDSLKHWQRKFSRKLQGATP